MHLLKDNCLANGALVQPKQATAIALDGEPIEAGEQRTALAAYIKALAVCFGQQLFHTMSPGHWR